MPLFRRRPTTGPTHEPDPVDTLPLSDLLLQGEDMIERLATAHRDRWGLGSGGTWAVDQTTATITWTFPDTRVHAPVQILATYAPGPGSWRWAWANPSITPALRSAADELRDWGLRRGHDAFTTPDLTVDETTAATLVALAVRVTRATGFYRGSGGTVPYLTFGDVTIEHADGRVEPFRVSVST
jgi:hypothetical protein